VHASVDSTVWSSSSVIARAAFISSVITLSFVRGDYRRRFGLVDALDLDNHALCLFGQHSPCLGVGRDADEGDPHIVQRLALQARRVSDEAAVDFGPHLLGQAHRTDRRTDRFETSSSFGWGPPRTFHPRS